MSNDFDQTSTDAEPGDALQQDDDLLTDSPGESENDLGGDTDEAVDLDDAEDTGQQETDDVFADEFDAGDAQVDVDGQVIESPEQPPVATSTRFPDIAQMSYEDARDQLVGVVQRLESGQAPLDETMSLWERGEALADHCARWLDRAEQRIAQSAAARND